MLKLRHLIIFFIVFIACGDNNKNTPPAACIKYYFEIINNDPSFFPQEEVDKLAILLPNKKYIFTPESAKQWPYFKSYGLQEVIPKDSFLFPHKYAHMFSSMDSFDESIIDSNGLKAQIMLNSKDQYGRVNFDMKIMKRDKNQWVKYVDTGNHLITRKNYNNKKEIIDAVYKTIVRYSFK